MSQEEAIEPQDNKLYIHLKLNGEAEKYVRSVNCMLIAIIIPLGFMCNFNKI